MDLDIGNDLNSKIISEDDLLNDFGTNTIKSNEAEIQVKPEVVNTPENTEIPKPALKKAKIKTAKFIVKRGDDLMSFVAAMLAGTDDDSEFSADNEDLQELAEIVAEWLPEGMGDIPPAVAFSLLFGLTYGPILRKAWKKRKEQQAEKEKEFKPKDIEEKEKYLQAEYEKMETLKAQMQAELERVKKEYTDGKEITDNKPEN